MNMKILVFSDSHASLHFMLRCAAKVKPDALIHLGDYFDDGEVLAEEFPQIPFYQVPGNCDRYRTPLGAHEILILPVLGVKLYMTHGHLQGVKHSLDTAIQNAIAAEADVLLYGHTHVPYEKIYPVGAKIADTCVKKPLLILCPGSIGAPPDGRPSFATLTLLQSGVLAGFGRL